MRDGWVETTLGEVATWYSGITPKATNPNFYGGNIPFLAIGDLAGGVVTRTERTLTEAGKNEIGRTAPVGAVFLSMYGSIGRSGIAGVEMTTNQAIAWAEVKPDDLGPDFLLLLLQHHEQDFDSLGRGATQRNINRQIIKRFPIALPPLEDQRRIVDLIASVDTAIGVVEGSRLAAGRASDAIGATDLLRDSAAKVVALEDVCAVTMGQSPPGNTTNTDGRGIPLLNGPTEFSDSLVGTPKQWTTDPKRTAQAGDLLFCVRGATAGRMNMLSYDSAIGRGLAAIHPYDRKDLPLIQKALSIGKGQLLDAAGGTIFPNVSSRSLKEFQLPWPDSDRRIVLRHVFETMNAFGAVTRLESTSLARLRSSLLSDLLSGHHEIPKSYDRFLEAAS